MLDVFEAAARSPQRGTPAACEQACLFAIRLLIDYPVPPSAANIFAAAAPIPDVAPVNQGLFVAEAPPVFDLDHLRDPRRGGRRATQDAGGRCGSATA